MSGFAAAATGAARAAALFLILAAVATVWSAPKAAAAGSSESGAQGERPRLGQSLPPLIPPSPSMPGPTPLTAKQKQALLKNNFEKMKREADELAALAKSLQEDLDKSNEHVLSLRVVDKAEQIEKLAKKLKSTATAY
ncbi:MAG TPA: hypothetical protein VGW33_07800 [Terriglobia bacterium]|nr:hypothetical protein [Terriglobia bacterium]